MGMMKNIAIDLHEDILRTKEVFGATWYSYDGMNWYKNELNAVIANLRAARSKTAEEEEIERKAEEERMRKCLW